MYCNRKKIFLGVIILTISIVIFGKNNFYAPTIAKNKQDILFVETDTTHKDSILLTNIQKKRIFETTWMELSETDSGYIVLKLPNSFDDQEKKLPNTIAVRNDTMFLTAWCEKWILKNVNIEKQSDDIYILYDTYVFKLVDSIRHIARWIRYYDVERTRVMNNHLYVDSLYNNFPLIDLDDDNYDESKTK